MWQKRVDFITTHASQFYAPFSFDISFSVTLNWKELHLLSSLLPNNEAAIVLTTHGVRTRLGSLIQFL